jgi:redox-sensitive bicupin YhaK (pirin superfamily)
MRGVLFWVNLARKDKGVEPSVQLLNPQDVPVRHEGDAIVRVLVGDGSPVELGTPGLILDVELPQGGVFSSPVLSGFNGFVYMRAGRGRCAARDALHAHGREAVRRDACLQRTLRGLSTGGPRHRTSVARPNASMRERQWRDLSGALPRTSVPPTGVGTA